MHSPLHISAKHYHDEYLRRHLRIPEPLERSRNELRRVIGKRLIHLGERLAGGEEASGLDRAA